MTNVTYNEETKELLFRYEPDNNWQAIFSEFHFSKVTNTLWKVPANPVGNMQAQQVVKHYPPCGIR